jgi:hypothetical protein
VIPTTPDFDRQATRCPEKFVFEAWQSIGRLLARGTCAGSCSASTTAMIPSRAAPIHAVRCERLCRGAADYFVRTASGCGIERRVAGRNQEPGPRERSPAGAAGRGPRQGIPRDNRRYARASPRSARAAVSRPPPRGGSRHRRSNRDRWQARQHRGSIRKIGAAPKPICINLTVSRVTRRSEARIGAPSVRAGRTLVPTENPPDAGVTPGSDSAVERVANACRQQGGRSSSERSAGGRRRSRCG